MRDWDSNILTGSTAASKGIPAFSLYSAAKAATRSFARSWIVDLAPRRIRVDVLAPGATSTPGWNALASSDEMRQQMVALAAQSAPLGRLGTPEESARVALFPASGDRSFVTGSELADGGSAQV